LNAELEVEDVDAEVEEDHGEHGAFEDAGGENGKMIQKLRRIMVSMALSKMLEVRMGGLEGESERASGRGGGGGVL